MRKAAVLSEGTPRFTPVAHKDRRVARRRSVSPQLSLPVVIRCGQGNICQGRVLNLSTQGMLVEFSHDQLPPIAVEGKVSVKLQYLGDSIWMPGLVRHRMGNKVGFFFPSLTNQPRRAIRHPLTIVLHSLSRAAASL